MSEQKRDEMMKQNVTSGNIWKPRNSVIMLLVAMTSTLVCAQDRPRVLIDLSHEFTFRYDIFGNPYDPAFYWSGTNRIDKTSTFASLTTDVLDRHDVLVVSQMHIGVPFTPEEMELIAAWVASGGGLWIAANRRGYFAARQAAPYPLQQLAELFGLTCPDTHRSGSYVVYPHVITEGVTDLVVDEGVTDNVLELLDAAWTPFIGDSEGAPVLAARSFGLGRVIVSAQDAIISNPYQNPDVSNVALIRNMVRWLAAARRGNRTLSMPYRILPEMVIASGPVDIYYPKTIQCAPGIEFVKTQFAPMLEIMENTTIGVGLAYDMRFVMLAGSGGGYSGGQEIGVAAHADPTWLLLVMAHELTHSFDVTGGWHPEWMHGWPSYAAMRVAWSPQYADTYAQGATDEYNSRVNAYIRYEDTHGTNSLDITEVDRGVFANAWAIGGKLAVMIAEMERDCQPDLIQRFYRLKRQYRSGQACSTTDMIHLFSLAGGTNLFPYFNAKGTTVDAELDVLPVVLRTTPAATDPFYGVPLNGASSYVSGQPIVVEFNTAMDTNTLTADAVSLVSHVFGAQPITVQPLSPCKLRIVPGNRLSEGDFLLFTLQTNLMDRAGRPLDGNGNGIRDGAADSYTWGATVEGRGPALDIRIENRDVVLYWPMNPNGFGLDQVEMLSDHIPWTRETNDITMTHGEWRHRPSRMSQQFFRLSLGN
jgi:hypothetical protein